MTNRLAAARATLRDGGGTFNARTFAPHAPASGYAVGLGNGSKVLLHDEHRSSASETAVNLTFVLSRAARAHPDAPYIGTWIDDGVIYIDPVVILQSREDALTLARALGEQAIYGFAEGESIKA